MLQYETCCAMTRLARRSDSACEIGAAIYVICFSPQPCLLTLLVNAFQRRLGLFFPCSTAMKSGNNICSERRLISSAEFLPRVLGVAVRSQKCSKNCHQSLIDSVDRHPKSNFLGYYTLLSSFCKRCTIDLQFYISFRSLGNAVMRTSPVRRWRRSAHRAPFSRVSIGACSLELAKLRLSLARCKKPIESME